MSDVPNFKYLLDQSRYQPRFQKKSDKVEEINFTVDESQLQECVPRMLPSPEFMEVLNKTTNINTHIDESEFRPFPISVQKLEHSRLKISILEHKEEELI